MFVTKLNQKTAPYYYPKSKNQVFINLQEVFFSCKHNTNILVERWLGYTTFAFLIL